MSDVRDMLQQLIDSEFNRWVDAYKPSKIQGRFAAKKAGKLPEDQVFYSPDEWISDFFVMPDGTNLFYSAIVIEPGFADSDLFFTSERSWDELLDNDLRVLLEVVVTCQDCVDHGVDCASCGNSRQWVIVPTAFRSM
mgnify:CR=1 FL=1